ncbi:hypothetical protein H310_09945 [Aphanomyces invadans]|uniref:MATE efflux family protein n=1 Tax=Aphanomyces invadans TaxID=157072 RepID=A0A024TSX8_9STRA|nr:hypothetical protein H310_09945 [Aphanomyces invadans]ETV97143.1 hypothetical protein H310_09945 [Aphanomyces invadans]|eukprot:XP_008874389.1 hypothetical protein H310_09945 [Aphanomyces invadans]
MTSRSRSNSTDASTLLVLTPSSLKHQHDLEKIHLNADAAPDARQETVALLQLAFPIIATLALEFLPGAFSVAIVGHIDSPLSKEYVDAATLSTMFLNITGLSIGFGLSTAMDTLCSQTVGAGKLYNLGMYFQSGLIVLASMYIPSVILNYHAEFFLLALGQDPVVAALAGTYSRVAVWCLPGVFLYELLKKILQAQNIVNPMAYIAVISNVVYGALGYFLCYHTELGFLGAAYARSISNTLLPIFAVAYLKWNPVYKLWWPADHSVSSQWKAALAHVPEFFALGIPGMLMMLMEWWAFEVCAVLAGWMNDPVLSISVHSVLMSLSAQAYSLFLGLSIATTVRLGNALGANEPRRAHMISRVALAVAFVAGLLVSIVFMITHDYLPAIFISDRAAIKATQNALAIFVVFELVDCLSCAAQSLLKGMGKQSVGAWVNAAAYYLFGIPIGALLAFHFGFGVVGLWVGLAFGLFGGFCIYLWFICTVNWKAMADDAAVRTST